jgi:hypothetical protein
MPHKGVLTPMRSLSFIHRCLQRPALRAKHARSARLHTYLQPLKLGSCFAADDVARYLPQPRRFLAPLQHGRLGRRPQQSSAG